MPLTVLTVPRPPHPAGLCDRSQNKAAHHSKGADAEERLCYAAGHPDGTGTQAGGVRQTQEKVARGFGVPEGRG